MTFRFDIVRAVANWAYLHVNSGRSRFIAPSDFARGSEWAERGAVEPLEWFAADSSKFLQSQDFFGLSRSYGRAFHRVSRGEVVAPAWYVDCNLSKCASGDPNGRSLRRSAQGEGWK